MSKTYQNRQQQKDSSHTKSNESQKKIDPVAQLKWLNNLKVDRGWGIFGDNGELIQKDKGQDEQEHKVFQSEGKNEELENKPVGHGVTNAVTTLTYYSKNGKSLRKSKEITIPAEKQLSIISENETGIIVSVEIDGEIYEGTIAKNVVNISPNTLEELNPEDKKNMVRNRTTGSSPGYKSTDFCNIHYGNLPKELHSFMDSHLDKIVAPVQPLSQKNITTTIPIEFHSFDLSSKLSDTDRKKYANNTFIFRFSRFNNGNKKDIILVEELACLGIKRGMNEEEKNRVNKTFADYGLSFIEPSSEAAEADKQLRAKIGKSDAATIKALHEKALLPLTDEEKDSIRKCISKLSVSILNDIQGLKFGKRRCKLDDKDKSIAEKDVGAYYSSGNHEVILVSSTLNIVKDVFGDKNGNFINRLENSILHEIGHEVDYAQYNEDKKELYDPLISKSYIYNIANDNANKAGTTYNNFIPIYKTDESAYRNKISKLKEDSDSKRRTSDQLYNEYLNLGNSVNGKKILTSSGVGFEINCEENGVSYSKVSEDNDFTRALTLDSPNITKYSNKDVKEAYAEAFALYISEPQSFKTLSPNVYEYFNKKYPQ